MGFEWDAKKAEAPISPSTSGASPNPLPVFEDDYAPTIADEAFDSIAWCRSVGRKRRVLVVVYTSRGASFRIISGSPQDAHHHSHR
jgi:uncharacterized DUF497 family protein